MCYHCRCYTCYGCPFSCDLMWRCDGCGCGDNFYNDSAFGMSYPMIQTSEDQLWAQCFGCCPVDELVRKDAASTQPAGTPEGAEVAGAPETGVEMTR
eukprot:g5679.t1